MPEKATVSAVQFYFQQAGYLKDRKRLKAFILHLFKKENTPVLSLNCIFCTDAYLLEINKSFLQHNYFTDIITFNLAVSKAPIEGEIYISLDRVRENAKYLKQYYNRELHRVIFHGVLHLCGYNDKTPEETAYMREKEEYYLKLFFK